MNIFNYILYRLFGKIPKKESTLEPNRKVHTYDPGNTPKELHQWTQYIHSQLK